MRLKLSDILSTYFVTESGKFVMYEVDDKGNSVATKVANRLGIVYEPDGLLFGKIGEFEEMMKWVAQQGTTKFVASPLPRDMNVDECNRLLADEKYLTTFLQKVGLV